MANDILAILVGHYPDIALRSSDQVWLPDCILPFNNPGYELHDIVLGTVDWDDEGDLLFKPLLPDYDGSGIYWIQLLMYSLLGQGTERKRVVPHALTHSLTHSLT